MSIDDERLLAWIDGELGAAEAAEVAAAVAGDPALAALVASHRTIAAQLRRGFDTLLSQPIPEELAAAARPTATITDLSAARNAREGRLATSTKRFQLPQWGAIAATLAVGIVAGQLIGEIGPEPIVTQSSSGLQASGQLAAALDDELASAPVNRAVRVQVTFRSRDGHICRTWSAAGQDGIACHAGDRWRITATLAASVADRGEYRMAGDGNPKLLGIIDGMSDGEAFDAKRELQARRDGWR